MKFFLNKKIILIALFIVLSFVITNFVFARTSEFGAPEGTGVASPEAGKQALAKPGSVPTLDAALKTASNPAPIVQPTGQTSDEVAHQVGVIAYIIGNMFGRILAITAWFVDFAVRLGNNVIDMGVVRLGWQIVLNFTNLGFVLAIIVIAFATIFRLESYALKQTLWKLIVAALLVNFSLVIAGAFISVSNSTTNIFLQATTVDNLSNALANTVSPQRFSLTIPPGVAGADSWLNPKNWARNTLANAVAVLAGLIFSIIFTFLAILVFFALFLMLLMRVIALVFLLILSPLAWLFWIFPYTQQYWKKWWTEFLRWNFFAPIVLFFVYLTVATAAGLDKMTSSMGASASDAAKAFEKTTMVSEGFIGHAAQLFIILGMLFGGLYVANQFGIAGGGLAYGWAQGAGKGFGRWAGRAPLKVGGAVTGALGGERIGRAARDIGDRWQRRTGVLNAPIRWAGKRLSGTGAGLERAATYKGPTLIKSVIRGMRIKEGKEPVDRIKQLRKDIDSLSKERDSLDKFLGRATLLAPGAMIPPRPWPPSVLYLTAEQQRRITDQRDTIDKEITDLTSKL